MRLISLVAVPAVSRNVQPPAAAETLNPSPPPPTSTLPPCAMNKVIDRRRSLDAQPDARRTTLFDYVTDLAGKTPTPGGGGAAAIAAGLGCAAGAMACAYSQRKKDQASGAAVVAAQTGATLSNAAARELDAADADAKAYLALQATWKKDFHGNKSEAQAKALAVPQSLVERCARHVAALDVFIPNATRTFCPTRRSGSIYLPVLREPRSLRCWSMILLPTCGEIWRQNYAPSRRWGS